MCGRTSLFADRDTLQTRFDVTVPEDYTPRYNIAPGEDLAVITNEAPETIEHVHWGVIPPWGDGPGDGLINARAETVAEKDVFAAAWEARPCLVPSSGFYEWQPRGGHKQPYRVHREDGLFAMAGLWERWTGGEEPLRTVTILTTAANDLMAPLHDRMPVILPPEAESTWLTAEPEERATLCEPYPDEDLEAYETTTRVNSPANDDPEVIKPLEHEQTGLEEFS